MISHLRHSDEIDVFEASMYFSGTSENSNLSWDEMSRRTGTRRVSLDFPIQNQPPIEPLIDHNQEKKKQNKKKVKLSLSPGSYKFASFLNSFFHQSSSSSKSKSRKLNSSTMADVDSIPKRSNSMSHDRLQNASTSTSNVTCKSYNNTDGAKKRVHLSPRRRCSWRWEEDDGGESVSSDDLFDLPSFRILDLK